MKHGFFNPSLPQDADATLRYLPFQVQVLLLINCFTNTNVKTLIYGEQIKRSPKNLECVRSSVYEK